MGFQKNIHIPLQVILKSNNDEFRFSCTLNNLNFIIHSGKLLTLKNNKNAYEGPYVNNLNPNMQVALINFLMKRCQIDRNLREFLIQYGEYMRRCYYRKWLENVNTIIG